MALFFPFLTTDNLQKAVNIINSRPKPLALYLFTDDIEKHEKVLNRRRQEGCVLTIRYSIFPPLTFLLEELVTAAWDFITENILLILLLIINLPLSKLFYMI